jgi:hypothetical protein
MKLIGGTVDLPPIIMGIIRFRVIVGHGGRKITITLISAGRVLAAS